MKPAYVIAAIGVGSFLAVLLVCGGMGVWFMFMVREEMQTQLGSWGPVTDINFELRGPASVPVNTRFTIEAVVENTASHPQQLRAIADYTSLQVHGSTPAWKNQMGNEFIYEIDIPPGQTQVIALEVEATSTGFENVNFDAHIGTGGFIEAFHNLQVTSP